MQSCCNYKSIRPATSLRRRALTLLELVVVLAILVVLSGMVVPLIQGLGYQTNSSTNATVVNEVNRAVGTFFVRNEKYPDQWDSLLTASDALDPKLHTTLTAVGTELIEPSVAAITSTQAKSLTDAGIFHLYDADQSQGGSSTPNRAIVDLPKLTSLKKNSTATLGDVFNTADLHGYDSTPATEYVVFGLGPNTTIRGTVITEAPQISSADPNNHYARVLCVFAIPGATAPESFIAKYVGCFMPDGTSLRSNVDRYNNSNLTE